MLEQHLGKPLTQVPDPFSNEYPSFGAHNNARLRAFLDAFGFEYEFLSSTEYYKAGRFDAALLKVLERFDEVMGVMLPSLREERAQTYSPFLPISPRTGIVLQVPIIERDVRAGTITYEDPDTKERMVTPVTGGHCKLQWKPDWAMRWVAFDVVWAIAGGLAIGAALGALIGKLVLYLRTRHQVGDVDRVLDGDGDGRPDLVTLGVVQSFQNMPPRHFVQGSGRRFVCNSCLILDFSLQSF
jgi:hypothetical protein